MSHQGLSGAWGQGEPVSKPLSKTMVPVVRLLMQGGTKEVSNRSSATISVESL